MGIKDFSDTTFDYYSNAPSYVRKVLSFVKDENELLTKKIIIKEIYNFLLSSFSEDEIKEICTVSLLFESRIEKVDNIKLNGEISNIYYNYLEKMIYDFYNRETIFREMNEHIKSFVGFYGIFKPVRTFEEYTEMFDKKKIK